MLESLRIGNSAIKEQAAWAVPAVELEKALADRIENIFGLYQNHGITICLIGSLGRAASISENPNKLTSEKGLRDIDILVPKRLGNEILYRNLEIQAQKLASPFWLEELLIGKIIESSDETSIRYKNIKIPVDPTIFEPKESFLFGTRVTTLDPNTLFHLTLLYGSFRPKDLKQLLPFARKLKNRKDILPEELFRPFHALSMARREAYPKEKYIGKLKWVYHKNVPYEMRRRLNFVMRPARKVIKKIVGWEEDVHEQIDQVRLTDKIIFDSGRQAEISNDCSEAIKTLS